MKSALAAATRTSLIAVRRNRLGSAVLVAAGLCYLAYPDDLIPDSAPFGFADDAVFLVLCLAAALFVAPDAPRHRILTGILFRIRVLRADLGNFGPIQHRYVDGFLISGKNSGSHWVKYMLSLALAEKHGLAPPLFCSGRHADAIVGRADRARSTRPFPQIATSHTIPSILLAWIRLPRLVRQPPIILLVRNIPDALRSGYRKWEGQYRVGLTAFIAGDPSGRRYIADAWWYTHFFNRWGAMHRAQPHRILLVHYETLLAETEATMRRIAAHLRLDLPDAAIARAVSLATKDRMRDLQDPDAGETIVPAIGAPPALRPTHEQVLAGIFRRFLRYDFDYRRDVARDDVRCIADSAA